MYKREIEKQKYIEIYKAKQYGSANHGWDIRWYFIENCGSFVDVGCGDGKLVDWGIGMGFNAVGVDFASGYGIEADAWNLPFEDNEYEFVTAFDMLEHLLPEDVDKTLDEFNRVASIGFIFSIAYVQSVATGVNDELLHPTVKPESWWLAKLKKYGYKNLEVKPPIGNSAESNYIIVTKI